MISKLAKLDWRRESKLWQGNVVNEDPNPKDPTKPYKISASGNNVKVAIAAAKRELGW